MSETTREEAKALDDLRAAIANYISVHSGETGILVDDFVICSRYVSTESMNEMDVIGKWQMIVPPRQSIYMSIGLGQSLNAWLDAELNAMMFGEDDD